jgi:energy-coupling factor transport system ATP-binding protein
VSSPVLTFQQVSYRYPGADRPALSEISLEVAPGETVLVAGGSGEGKSTLLRAACGLVPHFYGGVIAGDIGVAGHDTRTAGPGELAAAVGTLFQDPETQIVMGTVRAELAFPLENRGEEPAAVARGVEEAALALGIAHLLDRPTAELSGGELQRVALGAALAGRPRLLVLDEPTSQLDPVAGDELIGVLRRLAEDSDTAVLISEHRLERCLAAVDRVVALRGGRVACDAAPEAFLAWAVREAPELATPGARLLSGLSLPPVAGVRGARRSLRRAGYDPDVASSRAAYRSPDAPRPRGGHPALRLRGVWHELRNGPAILRGADLELGPGERVALMGRNGAGKSTLLRHAAGLLAPTRGRVSAAGRVALLLQNPGHYLIHDTVAGEASPVALRQVGLSPERFGPRHPRELSSGERQRLALAVVLDDQPAGPAAVVCLDEPTRGMDRAARGVLAALLLALPAAVIVATHDPEFAAAFAERVVLLADGAVIADAPVGEILGRGGYFATETARIVPGSLHDGDAIARLSAVAMRPEVPA